MRNGPKILRDGKVRYSNVWALLFSATIYQSIMTLLKNYCSKFATFLPLSKNSKKLPFWVTPLRSRQKEFMIIFQSLNLKR